MKADALSRRFHVIGRERSVKPSCRVRVCTYIHVRACHVHLYARDSVRERTLKCLITMPLTRDRQQHCMRAPKNFQPPDGETCACTHTHTVASPHRSFSFFYSVAYSGRRPMSHGSIRNSVGPVGPDIECRGCSLEMLIRSDGRARLVRLSGAGSLRRVRQVDRPCIFHYFIYVYPIYIYYVLPA